MEEVPALAKYVRRYDYVVAKDGSAYKGDRVCAISYHLIRTG